MATASPELRAVMMATTAPLIEEAAAIVARVAKDIERYKEIQARLDGAEVFLGEKLASLPPPSWLEESPASKATAPPGITPDRPLSWKKVVWTLLEGTERGYSAGDLMKRAPDLGLEEFAQRYKRNANAFLYGAKSLEADGLIIRRKGMYYLKKVWDRIQAGELKDAAPSRIEGLATIVLKLIEEDGPLTAGGLIEAYKRRESLPAIDPNRIYRILSKLHPRGTLIKDGHTYRLPTQPAPVAENVTLFPAARGSGGAPM